MPELKRRYGSFPKLSTAFTAIITIIGAIGVWAIGNSALKNAEEFQVSSRVTAARSGATALSMVFSNAIYREWESLNSVARNVDISSKASMNSFTDAVTDASDRVVWAGITNLSGKVVSGSGRILEGSDVSGQAWFRNAVKGPAVGQIVVGPVIGRGKNRSSRYIPMSVPLISENGMLAGVLVYQMKLSWMADYLSEAAMDLGLDIFVVDRAGKQMITGTLNRSDVLSQQTLTQLDVVGSAAFLVVSEGESEAVAITGDLIPNEMPQTGWHLIVRAPNSLLQADIVDLRQEVWGYSFFMLAGLIVTAMFMARYLAYPIERLALLALDIAEGRDVYPEEFGVTRETAALSDALARIQGSLPKKDREAFGSMR